MEEVGSDKIMPLVSDAIQMSQLDKLELTVVLLNQVKT